MAQQIKKGTTYVDYGTAGISQVTANNLNGHVDNAELLPGCISSQTEATNADLLDYLLIWRSGSLFQLAIDKIRLLFVNYFVPLSGGTMTGQLLLSTNNPTVTAAATSKGYVDTAIATGVSGATLPGAIVMWGGTSIPTGWLECNGQSTAGYTNLISIYGSTVPDLRGEFVRGWDNGRGVDPGRGLRTTQAGSVESHRHDMYNQRGGSSDGGGPYTQGAVVPGVTDQTGYYGGTETRPRNFSLRFIVKT